MAAIPTMEPNPHLATTSDLEIRAAKIADPNIDLRTKLGVAAEIREMLDTVRDTESVRALPYLIPAILELLRSGEVALHKDTVEYQFRRVLMEIINRLPVNETIRPHVTPLFNCMLYILRHDNEENGVTACKSLLDIIRGYRILTDESLADFVAIFQEAFRNMKELVEQVLSEDSAPVDQNVAFLSIRSFKVLGEMGMVMVIMSQVHRPMIAAPLQTTIAPAFEALDLESPAQMKTREDYEAMGGIWSGTAPNIVNQSAYSDFIHAQIKILSYLAYVMRYSGDPDESYGERLILIALRMLQDCPAQGIALRKELMVVFRHLMGQPARKALFPHLDKLFDENVLLGKSVASREMLRPAVYSAVADLVHHIRNELTATQLARIVHVYSRLIHNPVLGNLHTMSAKMIFGLAEPIIAKETPQGAARLLSAMFETCLERLETLAMIYDQVTTSAARLKENSQTVVLDAAFIEQTRPVGGALYAFEKPEEFVLESRNMFRTLLHGFRVCLASLRKCDAPIPDGELFFRLFEGCVRCMALFDSDPRVNEQGDAIDWFGHALLEINLHVFQEVWTHKIEFFFNSASKRMILLNICQFLFTREATSPTLLAIVLNFLVDRLELLGEYDDMTAAATIRLFKMAFGAVGAYPALNEPILKSHLAKLLMDCFPLAAKASKPTNYFHLLRALFRAIGGGGGRFELLYNAVLPLLPDMLESLNRQLLASEGQTRDMIVELCLTVPLRLTHLLPHLTYLMQPLALALRGNPELVSQGLRTLELCIDNLTPDFLDPTLSTVLRELMEALHSHLKPLPANHHPAHTTIRILGKLGGRNRRLLTKEPALKYRHHSDPARVAISFGGSTEKIELGPMSGLACRVLVKGPSIDRGYSYTFLENCLGVILHEGVNGRNVEEVFVQTMEGLFDAIHFPETQAQAEPFIHKVAHIVFDLEVRRGHSRGPGVRPVTSALLNCFLDALPHALAREQSDQAEKAQSIIARIIEDLVSMHSQNNVAVPEIMGILHQVANRFTALCLDDSWTRKSAGATGIKIMACTPVLGVKWVTDRDIDLVRTLLHILKDLPRDLPRDVDEVIDVLTTVLRISNGDIDFLAEGANHARVKLVHLVGIFFPELQSSNPVVRQAAQTCIELLVKLSGRPAVDLLLPHRDRMLGGIFTKPLRALPFLKQIGMIEAVRYCISLDPPFVELNDELLRLLHETLALADADDNALLGRVTARQGGIEVIQLRVACIKLLTASMPLTDFFQKQPQTRQRVTSVYFKSLYSSNPDVKEVAHEGLRMVLTHQSRLPKELLQTGLRPILMNLADPKRLSVPGLEGLARLLELLTNYFKVEIGHKLLDHFRIVADPQMLMDSSRLPLSNNEGITKLVRLANIFHLLPSAANIFLENLVNAIVQTESQMHFSTQSPFSEPLAKYLDRYPVEGVEFFLQHLNFPRHLRTFRSIIEARLAPNVERELASRTSHIVTTFLRGTDMSYALPAMLLFRDIARSMPNWVAENPYVIDSLLEVWHSEVPQPEQSAVVVPEVIQRHNIMLDIFMEASKQSPRIDLIFEIVSVFTRNLGMDLVRITDFLCHHVALTEDVLFRRNILVRFLTWFRDPSYSWSHKAHFLRYVVTPTLVVHASRPAPREQLLDSDFVDQIHRIIWRPINEIEAFAETDDMFKIEVLHFTTVMVHQYSELLEDVKKEIIKCAWHYITATDVIVKQTAYLLAARFFAAFQTPQKFILRAWTGLLRSPQSEGKTALRQEALATLAPSLPRADAAESWPPMWAKTTRRLLAEEGVAQHIAVYQLVVKQPDLFFPVRFLFIPHMANSLNRIGMSTTSTPDSRLLSVDLLQVIFNWEEKATQALRSSTHSSSESVWLTPLGFRENMVSYLVRLATMPHDATTRNVLVPRALTLLQTLVGSNGWTDVTVGLRFFSRTLEQNELVGEPALVQALASAKVLQVITAEQNDDWFVANAAILQKLVQKGLVTDDYGLHDALHPIFERLIKLFPLPKEEDEQASELSEFHSFVYSAIGEGLRNSTALRGTLLMLKSVVKVVPERIEPFSQNLMKLLSKLAKEHIQTTLTSAGSENGFRLLKAILEICQISVAFLADQRRWLLSTLVVLVEKSKSVPLCRYMLDLARTWAMPKQEAYPTMKEKASLLQKMIVFESRSDVLFHPYLELIYEIYTEPSLRRSDLTTRLEHSFLLGCRAKDSNLRERFMDLLDVSVPRSLLSRLTYIFGVQSWDALADQNWIYLALHLILGATDTDTPTPHDRRSALPSLNTIARPKTHTIIRPIQRLLFLDPQVAHATWISVFPAVWACLSRREQSDITHHMINLLSKDYHIRQAQLRPNIIQTLLAGIHACSPPMTLPPHLVKYLAKTFGAWHVSLEILAASFDQVKDDEPTVRDYVYDSLADVYAELAEEDMFYGLWRRRCLHQETNIAIAFEQNGMWEQASNAYESAQSKSRAGAIPFSESEYCLWEDHWILAAEKLQHWDLLYDLAKAEENQELMLESAWRTVDWAEQRESLEEQISRLPEIPTPRRRVFEAFIALLKLPAALEKNVEFTRILEDAMQLSLRKWVSLPPYLSAAHVPLLQHFQQFVELQEAVQIFGSLSQTNAQNLEKKSSELKMVLQAWRERLPNLHDDISIWSDLVAWRQNVFHSINNAYIPLISGPNQGSGAATSNANTFGYRGYHETAWIINRFAHVARKHDLLDVCFTSLTKIYTLPNIEISEAFLKLREQARCHYQKPNDLQAGLEVINNTNLMFFSASQKAEFHTLKGMFHARFNRNDEANHAFGQAVQLDITQAKAWAEWGRFNDRMFKETPNDLSYAANAVSCYLQAAGQYKNGKSRPLITRILWLLSLDDNALTISRAFDTYKGDAAYWFWIPLIPQLCLSISHREVKQARYVLLNLARLYPQALFYHLRSTREEMQLAKRSNERAAAARAALNQTNTDPSRRDGTDANSGDLNALQASGSGPQTQSSSDANHGGAGGAPIAGPSVSEAPGAPRQPLEYIDEVLQVLKTSFPLLVLSLETMVDQIQHKFKLSTDEDIYRNICLLLQDAIQTYVLRMNGPEDDVLMSPQNVQNLVRFAQTIPLPVRKEYEEDFLSSKPTHYEYIQKLQQWRDKYELLLDARPRLQPLAVLSHYLTEFQYNKVDEIEVPGQYTEDKDSNQNFVRIQKFSPKFENCRSSGASCKRFTLHGSDNSKTSFTVQLPALRQYRREDRVIQIFRTFNGALSRKKESRKRNLSFHLPAAVSCSPSVRLFQTDSSYVPLGDIYDRHCQATGISREEPVLYAGEKVKKVLREFRQPSSRPLTKPDYINLKKEIYDEITIKLIPEDIITRYLVRTMADPSELWRMRKQFALQIASSSFMTYILCLSSRHPTRYHLSRATGLMAMTELLPPVSQQTPVFATSDVVPFRFTPNMQHFLGPIFTEGILTSGMMAIGRCLTEPEFDLEQQLCLFGRDEVTSWMTMRGRPHQVDLLYRQSVAANIDAVVKRAETMACKAEREQAINSNNPGAVPVVQTVTNLISSATNPLQLAKMGETYYPWF
ncbi:Transcription-associated protein 1 [Hypsizygus marmoreus]|uniref:Transcription-associated protein 1 n=1 Tax=Hypsizygus marmoreus TaxID=39966 RepID=A0A369JQM7_HYPMA|nr:Transcription-associated protein 1 [Hypsizygus marmoreus]